MQKFNRVFSVALIIFILFAALATPAMAKGKAPKRGKARNNTAALTSSSIVLITPSNQETCKPSDVISTTGVPDGATVKYTFNMLQDGRLVRIGYGTVSGNMSVPFPYPEITGTMTFHVVVKVFDGTTLLFKAQRKWSITCNETPPPPPPPGGVQGCTPGYWRQDQHFDSWTVYSPGDDFETVFGVDASFDPHSLLDAVWLGGGGEFAMARHAVAALLNANSAGVDYHYTVADVIAMVKQAYATGDFESIKNQFEAQNETSCPLN